MSKPRLRPMFPIIGLIKRHDPEWFAANRHRPVSALREWPGFEKYKGWGYDDATLDLIPPPQSDRLLNPPARTLLRNAAEWASIVLVVALAVPLAIGLAVTLVAIYAAMLAVVLMQRPGFWVAVLMSIIVAKLVGWM